MALSMNRKRFGLWTLTSTIIAHSDHNALMPSLFPFSYVCFGLMTDTTLFTHSPLISNHLPLLSPNRINSTRTNDSDKHQRISTNDKRIFPFRKIHSIDGSNTYSPLCACTPNQTDQTTAVTTTVSSTLGPPSSSLHQGCLFLALPHI